MVVLLNNMTIIDGGVMISREKRSRWSHDSSDAFVDKSDQIPFFVNTLFFVRTRRDDSGGPVVCRRRCGDEHVSGHQHD